MGRRFYNHISKIPTDYILCYDFDGDYQDKSVNSLHGIKTGDAVFEDGLKGKKSLKFTNGCVRTPSVLIPNSNKASISVWIKTIQTSTGIVMELSQNVNSNNAFAVVINDFEYNKGISIVDQGPQGFNIKGVMDQLPITTFTHVVIIVDRSLDGNQTKFYINKILKTTKSRLNADIVGGWSNYIMYIGQRGASSIPFVGFLQNLKIYNRVLSEDEITALYNELL